MTTTVVGEGGLTMEILFRLFAKNDAVVQLLRMESISVDNNNSKEREF